MVMFRIEEAARRSPEAGTRHAGSHARSQEIEEEYQEGGRRLPGIRFHIWK